MSSISLKNPILAHPSVIFGSIWLLVLFLCSLELIPVFSRNISNVYVICVVLIISNMLGAGVGCLIKTPRQHRKPSDIIVYKKIHWVLTLWAIVSIVEIGVFKGLPLIWIIQGSNQTYADFGLPTIHGFSNAMWLLLCFNQFQKLLTRDPKWFVYFNFILLIAWPVLLVSRALFTIFFLQAVVYTIITSRVSILRLCFSVTILLTCFFYAFGWVGDARSSYNIVSSLDVEKSVLAESNMLWGYSYIVSPISNLALGWSYVEPTYSWFPRRVLTDLLPTILKNLLEFEKVFEGYAVLTHGAFNVGTAFLAAYYDWGKPGVILMAFAIGCFGHLVWRSAFHPQNIPLLSAYAACTILTMFTNQFTQLVPVVYMFLMWVLPATSNEKV